MSKAFVVLAMLFCHIIDDYYLQGWLASAKQEEWWEKNAPQPLYKHDYLMALAMHSMSWAFMILLPIAIYNGFNVGPRYVALFVGNSIFHAIVDDAKANMRVINLITDQMIHIAQIIITACVFML